MIINRKYLPDVVVGIIATHLGVPKELLAGENTIDITVVEAYQIWDEIESTTGIGRIKSQIQEGMRISQIIDLVESEWESQMNVAPTLTSAVTGRLVHFE